VLGSGHPQADIMMLKYAPRPAEIEEDAMRKVVAYELLSLDGVAEHPDEFVTEFDEVMRENLGRVIATQDVVLLGRRNPGFAIHPATATVCATGRGVNPGLELPRLGVTFILLRHA